MTDRSISHPHNYSITFNRIPNTVFYCQQFTVPTMNLGQVKIRQDDFSVPIPGDQVFFDDVFTCAIINDEQYLSYEEIYSWMMNIRNTSDGSFNIDLRSSYSDAVLTVRGNNSQAIGYFNFVDCFPVRLSGLDFKTTVSEDEPLIIQADFAFTRFNFNRQGFPEIPSE